MAVVTGLLHVAGLPDHLWLAWAAAPEAEPTVIELDPPSAPNDLDAPIVITGTSFEEGASMWLNGTPLHDVAWVNSTRLEGVVPWGMDPGPYTVTVSNPDGSAGTLPNAFTVTQGIGVWNAGELYGGSVEHLVLNPLTPTRLYAASDQVGVFRSHDGAESWSIKYASVMAGYLDIEPVSPHSIYIEAFGRYYRSDDEGDTWVPLTTTFPVTDTSGRECWGGQGIHAHPSIPGTVYAQACDPRGGPRGLIKSTNWGQDWDPVIDGLTDTQVTTLAFHPDDPEIMVLGTANGNVYRSLDGGAWWDHASKPLGYVATLAINPFGGREVWISSLNAYSDPCALMKSADAGLTTWTAMVPDPGETVCAMSIDFAPAVSGTVFVAGMKDYQTVDGGVTWQTFGPADVSIQDIALHPTDPGIIYIGDTYLGVHRTTDGGTTWEIANHGLTAIVPQQIETVPGQPDTVYTLVSGGQVYKGTRGGSAWQRLPISGTDSLLVDPVSPTLLYAGLYGYVYASTDGGDSWPTRVELVPPAQYATCDQLPVALLSIPGQPGTVLAGMHHWCGVAKVCPGSIYRSTDYGHHWDQVLPTGTQEISQVQDMAYDPMAPAVVYAATGEAGHGGGLLRSTDAGLNWEPVGTGVIDWALEVAVEPGTHRVFVSGGGLPLYVSDDGGATWAPTGLGEGSNVYDILFAPGTPPVLYDAAAQGLYRSADGGRSWQPAVGALGQVTVYSLGVVTATDRVILYAGTTGGYAEGGGSSAGSRSLPDIASGYLVNAGVYRWTSLTPGGQIYLPLVMRSAP
jgi:photosystem II stability/assembly factor-like uncharacterized protein